MFDRQQQLLLRLSRGGAHTAHSRSAQRGTAPPVPVPVLERALAVLVVSEWPTTHHPPAPPPRLLFGCTQQCAAGTMPCPHKHPIPMYLAFGAAATSRGGGTPKVAALHSAAGGGEDGNRGVVASQQ